MVSADNGELKLMTMPADHSPDRIEPGQPETMIIKLEAILEPELAARCSMSDDDMAELIGSLDEIGQRNPIQLMRRGELFEIIDGHRRFLAARELNRRYQRQGELRWTCLRAEVYPEGDPDLLAARLHANIIREQLNPAEEAVYMRQAMERFGLDLAGLCRLFHRSESYIDSRFKLLFGDPKIMQAVAEKRITLAAAHQLNRITDEPMRNHYLDCALRTSPPGHVVANWVNEWKRMKPYLEQATMGAVEPQPQPEPEVYQRACAFCGGYLDQGNLIEVTVHKYEWERFITELRKAAGGGQ
jgi:ParB/RepB/Spo0J family partition protein